MNSNKTAAHHTRDSVTEEVQREIKRRLEFYSRRRDFIDQRLAALDKEWDVERVLELNSSILSLFGLTMGLLKDRRWLLLPTAVQTFFLQHATQGWCPPLPILRELGFRTRDEINEERMGLKILRGDFKSITTGEDMAENGYHYKTQQLLEALTA